MKDIKDNWEVTTERYVAFIDIMGFKDLVSRQTHSETYDMMKAINLSRRRAENVRWNEQMGYVRTTNYSDSIMIYSKDSSENSLYSFACSVASITDDLFKESIPHKGAFAFGTMTLDTKNSIFYGQPLIDAYLLQEEVYFYGIVGHASAERQLQGKKQVFINKFPCFFKNGISEHLIINPIHFSSDGKKDPYHKDHIELLGSIQKLKFKTSGAIRKYIDNTDAYFKHFAK